MLVFGKLKLSFWLKWHVLNLGLISHVLLVDFVYLILSIATDLVKGFLIVFSDLAYVIAKLLSCILGSFHIFAELL